MGPKGIPSELHWLLFSAPNSQFLSLLTTSAICEENVKENSSATALPRWACFTQTEKRYCFKNRMLRFWHEKAPSSSSACAWHYPLSLLFSLPLLLIIKNLTPGYFEAPMCCFSFIVFNALRKRVHLRFHIWNVWTGFLWKESLNFWGPFPFVLFWGVVRRMPEAFKKQRKYHRIKWFAWIHGDELSQLPCNSYDFPKRSGHECADVMYRGRKYKSVYLHSLGCHCKQDMAGAVSIAKGLGSGRYHFEGNHEMLPKSIKDSSRPSHHRHCASFVLAHLHGLWSLTSKRCPLTWSSTEQ